MPLSFWRLFGIPILMNTANAPDGTRVPYNTARVDDIDIFSREVGPADAPVILLLHGLPSSSRMYQPLPETSLSDTLSPYRPGLSRFWVFLLTRSSRLFVHFRSSGSGYGVVYRPIAFGPLCLFHAGLRRSGRISHGPCLPGIGAGHDYPECRFARGRLSGSLGSTACFLEGPCGLRSQSASQFVLAGSHSPAARRHHPSSRTSQSRQLG